MDQITSKNKGGPGRPRNPDIEERVVKTAYKVLAKFGYEGLSFAKVSVLSGVARPTLKLRWRTREEWGIATVKYILDRPAVMQIPENLGSHNIKEIIISVLEGLIITLNNPETARILTSILAAAHFSGPLGELRQYALSRRGIVLRRLVEMGIEKGEFSKTIDIEFALDGLNGPILYRTLILGMTMELEMARTIVNNILPPPDKKNYGQT